MILPVVAVKKIGLQMIVFPWNSVSSSRILRIEPIWWLKNDNICKALYDKFVDKEYSYLHTMTGHPGIPQLPLPWCYETRIKQAFLNPKGRPFTGSK